MKHIFALAIAVIIALPFVFADTLIFYETFDDQSSLTSNNCISCSVSSFGDGIKDNSALFGSGSDLRFPSSGNIDDNEGTVSFWVKPVSFNDGNPGGNGYFDYNTLGTSPSIGVYRHIETSPPYAGDGNVYFEFKDSVGSPQLNLFEVDGVEIGEWTNIVISYHFNDPGNDFIRLYINGAFSQQIGNQDFSFTPLQNYFTVGDVGWYSRADAYIDDLKIYDYAVPSSEIYDDYNLMINYTPPVIPPVKPESTGNVKVNQSGLFLNGQPFFLKAVGYEPTPIGSDYSYPYFTDATLRQRDFPILRAMGANTLRPWATVNSIGFLDDAYNNGVDPLYVVMSFYINPLADMTNPAVRESIKQQFRNYVNTYKDHPAVLMWNIGNEVNMHRQDNGLDVASWFTLLNELAEEAYVIEGDSYHPVTTSNQYLNHIDPAYSADDSSMTYLDAWGINVYVGTNFDPFFSAYNTKSSRPVWISEYGVDSWHVDNPDGDPSVGYEDEYSQADWEVEMWQNLETSQAFGASVMAYSDGWNKDWHPGASNTVHDYGGYKIIGCHPDDYSNEEWYGIVKPIDNGASPDIIQPKDAYYILASEFTEPKTIDGFQKGFTFTSYWNNQYLQPQADLSLEWLKDTGTEWVTILVTQYQDSITSTTIYPRADTPSDAAVIHAIDKAHSLGMKVMLKPHVDITGYADWRGNIAFSNEADWQAWFDSYTDFIDHYADLAEANNVEALVMGTELKSTTHRDTNWRTVIGNVRTRFSGPITYSANHDNYYNVGWWDALDYIGISAYFPLTSSYDPTVQELIDAWAPIKSQLSAYSQSQNKEIIFTEVGFQSYNGANTQPNWAPTSTIDLQEQADCYEATFQALINESWLKGFNWWMWYWNPLEDTNKFDIYGKPAEDVLRSYYIDQSATDYNITEIINGSSTEYRFFHLDHHFMTIVDDQGTFNIRPHPGTDVNGWGSSLYMQPFLPGAVIKHTAIQSITAETDGIHVTASGLVSKDADASYGNWDIDILFSYDPSLKEADGLGTYSITLDSPLSASTGDLNLLKLASNYLDDVPLLTGGIGDTGDMDIASVTLDSSSFDWNPSIQHAHFPGDQTDSLSVDVTGQVNVVDSAAQGHEAIDPAYKPSLKIELNSQQAGIPMIFGGIYDNATSQDFWEDNVGITPLILKQSPAVNYNFDIVFHSAALPGDGVDLDFDSYLTPTDCDDNNILVHPGATEVCNGIDDNCVGGIDENTDAGCDDGLYCNGQETCQSGSCASLAPVNCDDSVGCTVDSCNEAIDSCDYTPNNALCDNSLYCDGIETCDALLDCQSGTPINCDDSVSCTDDSCNEAADSCDNTANNAICDNSLYCDGIETCDALLDCQTGTPVDCSANDLPGIAECNNDPDNNPFTWDASDAFASECNEASDSCTTGTYTFIHSCDIIDCSAECEQNSDCPDVDCDYLDGCNGNDYHDYADVSSNCLASCSCEDNVCGAPTITVNDPRCTECQNDNDCDYLDNDYCDGTLDKHDEGRCIAFACSVETTTVEDCDNNLYCDGQESCNAGACVAGTPVNCDDSVGCTDDSCNEAADSCDNTPNNAICDNSLYCDGIETCDALLDCQSGTIIDCSANNLAEIATCNNNPDNDPLTWDAAAPFTSVCDEASDSCTTGTQSLTHNCDISTCGAECTIDTDCDDSDPLTTDTCVDCICYNQAAPEPGVIFYEPCDSTASIAANGGDTYNTPAFTPGLNNNAFDGTASNFYAYYPMQDNFPVSNGTVEFWLKRDFERCVGYYECNGYFDVGRIGSKNSMGLFGSGSIWGEVRNEFRSMTQIHDGSPQDNDWHHVVLTWKEYGENCSQGKVYVDGSRSTPKTFCNFYANMSGDMFIGMSMFYGYSESIIDEFRIYNYAKTESEVLQDFEAVVAEFRPEIISYSPQESIITVEVGTPQLFSIDYNSPSGADINITWYVEGVEVKNEIASSSTLTHTINQQGTEKIEVVAEVMGFPISQEWYLLGVDSSSDCVVPYGGLVVDSGTVTLCPGKYYMNGTIFVGTDMVLECNDTVLSGSSTLTAIDTGSRGTVRNCEFEKYLYVYKGGHRNGNVFENNVIRDCSTAFYLHDEKFSEFRNNTIIETIQGFHIWWGSYYNEFIGNTIEDSSTGFYFDHYAGNNLFEENNLYDNYYGFYHSPQWYGTVVNATFVGNDVRNNNYGFYLGATYNSTIRDNTIIDNNYGIRLINSVNNTIYFNNFINNTNQWYEPGTNIWDNGLQGNYWSNYDEESEGCFDTDADGICDSPYVIDANNSDNYPFTTVDRWPDLRPEFKIADQSYLNIAANTSLNVTNNGVQSTDASIVIYDMYDYISEDFDDGVTESVVIDGTTYSITAYWEDDYHVKFIVDGEEVILFLYEVGKVKDIYISPYYYYGPSVDYCVAYIGKAEVSSIDVLGIVPGETREVNLNWVPTRLGYHTLHIFANATDDSNWYDNYVRDTTEVIEVTCLSDADCPADSYGDNYCSAADIFRDLTSFICINPGTPSSECQSTVTPELVQACDDSLYCNGQESCQDAVCVPGSPIDCSANNLAEIATCSNDPDNNPFTWDSAAAFTSTCNEASDSCTTGTQSFTHTCDITQCSAECESNSDCDDGDALTIDTCQSDCTCSHVQDYLCTDSDGGEDWYVKGIAQKQISPRGSRTAYEDRCLFLEYIDGNPNHRRYVTVDECYGGRCNLQEGYCLNNQVSNEPYYCHEEGMMCKQGACVPMDDMLLAHYTFEGDAEDVTGHDHTGHVRGPSLIEGVAGQAYEFDGNDDYIYLDMYYNETGAIDELTVCAWFRTDYVGSQHNENWALVDFDRSEYFHLLVSGATGQVGFGSKGAGQPIDDTFTASPYNDGNWHFACGVYDGTDKIVYVDSVEDARTPNAHNGNAIGSGVIRYGFIGDGSEAADINGNRNNKYYEGAVDEVRIYNYALTPGEIQDLYNQDNPQIQEPQTPELIAHYKFEGNADDETGSHDGAVNGASIVSGVSGDAYEFDGTDDYLALDMYYDTVQSIDELTVCAWFKTSFQGNTFSDNWALVDFDRSEYYNLFVRGDNGKIGFGTKGSAIDDFYSSADDLNDGQWHYACAVYDGDDKIIYIDGFEDAVKAIPHSGSALGSGLVRYGFIGDGSEAVAFDSNRNEFYYEGAVDEVRIYNHALNADDIQTLYDEDKP